MRDDILESMKDIGIYDKSFEISINILDGLLNDYRMARKVWQDDGCQLVIEYTNKQGKTNTIKNPLYQSMEKLRMDILSYAKELGLTPSGLKKLKGNSFQDDRKVSKVEEVLLKLSQG